jgi:hypothetical protein
MARTAAPAKNDDETLAEVTAEVENIIERLNTLTKDDAEAIETLKADAEEELKRIPGTQRAKLRTRVKTAAQEASDRKPASTEIALRPETTDVTTIENYAEILDNAATLAADGLKAETTSQESAAKLAEALLDARLRITAKNGLPDLKGTRQASKDFASQVYDTAFAKLAEEGFSSAGTIDGEEARKRIQESVKYQMTGVLPKFVRALNDSPEVYEEYFGPIKEKNPDAKPADAVFEAYGINPLSKAEIAAANRAAKRELTANGGADAEGDEIEDGEGDGDGDGGEGSTKSPVEKVTASLDKDLKALSRLDVDALSDVDAEILRGKLLELATKTQEVAIRLTGRGK